MKTWYLECIWLWSGCRYSAVSRQQERSTARYPSWRHSPSDQSMVRPECRFCIQSTSQFLCEVIQCVDQPSLQSTKKNKGRSIWERIIHIFQSRDSEITSPSSSNTRRSTPWAAGCCGPKFKLMLETFFSIGGWWLFNEGSFQTLESAAGTITGTSYCL